MTSVESVYRDNRSNLLRVIAPRCRVRHEAEDVLHDALAKLIEKRRDCAANLLYTTAVNLAFDRRKQAMTRARLNPFAMAGREDAEPSPERALSESQFAERFELALGQLVIEHEDWATAFLLRTQHELEWADIGRQMGVGARMAQIYVARAVEYCHEYIES